MVIEQLGMDVVAGAIMDGDSEFQFVELAESAKKEQIHRAYMSALLSHVGLNTYTLTVDNESVDVGLIARGVFGTKKNPRLEVQLKCTSHANIRGTVLKFKLKQKNYEDLSETDLHVPKILVVLALDPDPCKWVVYDHEAGQLTISGRAYWLSMTGFVALNEGQTSKVVDVPLNQVFGAHNVTELIGAVGIARKPENA